MIFMGGMEHLGNY